MSRNAKPNLGEPYQIYSEVTNAGKNVQGSKRKCRWLIGFTEKEGEVEVALIHSVVSGKKTVFEDGREITSSTNYLATDFGHTWRSETCPGRLFRVEFSVSMTTEPTIYTFMVDGIKFVDMPKKGSIGGGGSSSGGDYRRSSNYGGESQPRTINGFGGGAPSTRASVGGGSGTTSGFGKQQGHSDSFTASSAPAPAPSTNRRYIYGDDDDDEEPAKPAAPAPVRGSFQSPAGPASAPAANTNSGFGFDPFSESPAPAPAAKSSAAASLFNAFEESPPANKANTKGASFDPFGGDPFAASADPFASPAAAPPARQTAAPKAATSKSTPPTAPPASKAPPAAAAPNFFDDDFAPAPTKAAPPAPASDFGSAFPTSVNNTPARRTSAVEISMDFAGLSIAAPAPPQPTPAAQLFAPTEPEPEPTPPPAPAPVNNDPWAAGGDLVNLDLMNTAAPKRASVTASGPSLASMMTSPSGSTGMGNVPVNSRASFTAGPSPLDLFGASPAPVMGGAPMGMNNVNPRASFTAGPGAMPMGMGMGGAPMGGMGGAPMGGMGGMGGAPMGNMGGMNNANTRGSMTGGPVQMGNMGMGGMPPAGGNMSAMGGSRGSFISTQPPAGPGYGAPAQPPKNSLDSLDWNM